MSFCALVVNVPVVFVSLRRFRIVVTAVCCVVSFSSFCIFISPFSMRCFVLVLHFLLLLSVVRSLPFALRKIPAPDGRHPPCTRRLLVPAGPVRRLPPTRKRCGRSSVALVPSPPYACLFNVRSPVTGDTERDEIRELAVWDGSVYVMDVVTGGLLPYAAMLAPVLRTRTDGPLHSDGRGDLLLAPLACASQNASDCRVRVSPAPKANRLPVANRSFLFPLRDGFHSATLSILSNAPLNKTTGPFSVRRPSV